MTLMCAACAAQAGPNVTRGEEIAREFGVHEIALAGNGEDPNPFGTDCNVTFIPPTKAPVTVRAFYDGGGTWRVRLYVFEVGRWRWAARSDDPKLDGQAGAFVAVDSRLRGKMRPHPHNPHQWMTDNGQTFLNLSDTAYILFRGSVPFEDFVRYVEDDAALGATSLRAGGGGGYAGWGRHSPTLGHYERSNWCWERDVHKNDFYKQFDLARFQATDRRLEYLLNHHPDLYVQLILFGKTSDVGRRWFRIPKRWRQRTLDYMIARWAAWPQVFFQIVNDTVFVNLKKWPQADRNVDMVREIGEYLAEHDPFHTLRSAGCKRYEHHALATERDFGAWHTYLHVERYAEVDGKVCDDYYRWPVHLFYGEDWYEQPPRDQERILHPDYYYRRLFWSVLLSGGSPNYGGRYPVLHPYSTTGRRPFQVPGHTYTEPLKGLNSVIHIKRYFETRRIDLAEFEPDDAAARAIPAPKPEPNGPSRAQCARRGHDEYLIYLPCAKDGERSGGDRNSKEQRTRTRATLGPGRTPGVRVDLRQASGTFAVEWYRADTGQARPGEPVPGRGVRTLTSPWKGVDVVVRLVNRDEYRLRRTDIFPHRGGSADAPQNTLYAFRRNLHDGFSLDMDIRKTADGEIVVIHDQTTGRTCDQDWVVAEKTVAELQTLDAAYKFDPKGDHTFPLRGKGVIIPTLEEVFRVVAMKKRPGLRMWIDTKDDESYPFEANQRFYDRVIELIGKYGLWEEALIEVSRVEEAEALRHRDARVRVVWWGKQLPDIHEAIRYAHYARIGVPLRLAAEVADAVRAAGKKLHVTHNRLTADDWAALRALKPGSLGIDHLSELLPVLGDALR